MAALPGCTRQVTVAFPDTHNGLASIPRYSPSQFYICQSYNQSLANFGILLGININTGSCWASRDYSTPQWGTSLGHSN